jgi:hypothetical protein
MPLQHHRSKPNGPLQDATTTQVGHPDQYLVGSQFGPSRAEAIAVDIALSLPHPFETRLRIDKALVYAIAQLP